MKTPFWSLFNCIIEERLKSNDCKKSEKVIVQIIKAYNPFTRKFKLGRHEVKLTAEDIALIFGISSGCTPINKSYSSKPDTSFVRRCFAEIDRLSASKIKNATIEASTGARKIDRQDVARLLSLYTLVTLFFPTTGPTIGWSLLKFIENLDEIKTYAWSEKIWKTLMDSIAEHHTHPEKVSGCVIALPYWLLEHTTLYVPYKSKMPPRLVKWRLRSLLNDMQSTTLKDLQSKQVIQSELKATKYEKVFVKNVEDEVSEYDAGIVMIKESSHDDESNDRNEKNEEREEHSDKHVDFMNNPPSPDPIRVDGQCYIQSTPSTDEHLLVESLRDEIKQLKQKLEEQSSTISSMETMKNKLDDRILELEVHNVTQVLRHDINSTEPQLDKLNREHQQASHEHKLELMEKNELIAKHMATIQALEKQVEVLLDENMHLKDKYTSAINDFNENRGLDVVFPVKEQNHHADNQSTRDHDPSTCKNVQTSLVRNIKAKERKQRVDPEYMYERQSKKGSRKTETGAGIKDSSNEKIVYVLDDPEPAVKRQKKTIHLSFKNPVGRFLTAGDKKALEVIYEKHGNGAVVWSGEISKCFVSMDDILYLLTDMSISNFVIDGFTEILYHKQSKRAEKAKEPIVKSLFFTSTCETLIKNQNFVQKKPLIDDRLDESGNDYSMLFFTLNHDGIHWTLLVFDIENGLWTHYDSLLPRNQENKGRYNKEVQNVKDYVENYWKDRIEEARISPSRQATMTFYYPIETCNDCPQQKYGGLDCGAFVCYFIKCLSLDTKRFENFENAKDKVLPSTLTLTDIRKFRTEMISMFINDGKRSWPNTNFTKCTIEDDDFLN